MRAQISMETLTCCSHLESSGMREVKCLVKHHTIYVFCFFFVMFFGFSHAYVLIVVSMSFLDVDQSDLRDWFLRHKGRATES